MADTNQVIEPLEELVGLGLPLLAEDAHHPGYDAEDTILVLAELAEEEFFQVAKQLVQEFVVADGNNVADGAFE